jgi:Zn-dependent protease with chaperone function
MSILVRSLRAVRRSAILSIAALLLIACATVPLTGRRQLSLVPEGNMLSMSFEEYGDFLKKNPPSADRAGTEMVVAVGKRVQGAVERFFAMKGMSSKLSGYQWEFHLVDSKEVNAWCMPGGKVVVYSGILPVAKDEAGLAVVLGHEIAHAVADHGNERMSQGLLAQAGGMALDAALQKKPDETRKLWNSVFGVGAQYGALLPFSRIQESEADHLGLIFMAMAGYDPHEATSFWERMSHAGGKAPPEFMSSHPSDETRIRKIAQEIPEAMTYYKKR